MLSALYVTPFLDQNLSLTKNGAIYYYSQDGLGSVRTLSDLSGASVNRYDYTAWGEIFAPGTSAIIPQRYSFTGRECNPTSPLMYYRYRQYDARQGRFGQRDVVIASGIEGLYAYACNCPARLVDQYGLIFDDSTPVEYLEGRSYTGWLGMVKNHIDIDAHCEYCDNSCYRMVFDGWRVMVWIRIVRSFTDGIVPEAWIRHVEKHEQKHVDIWRQWHDANDVNIRSDFTSECTYRTAQACVKVIDKKKHEWLEREKKDNPGEYTNPHTGNGWERWYMENPPPSPDGVHLQPFPTGRDAPSITNVIY